MAGALNGPDAALGINIKNGVQLALDQHNAANPGCQIELRTFDTEGDPQKATAIAPQIVDDESIIGLIGPAFSGETKATGGVFDQAGQELFSIAPDISGGTLLFPQVFQAPSDGAFFWEARGSCGASMRRDPYAGGSLSSTPGTGRDCPPFTG